MTVKDSLRAISPAPLSDSALELMLVDRGVDGDAPYDTEVATSEEYRLLRADALMHYAMLPSLSESGISISLTAEQQATFRAEAMAIYNELGDPKGKGRYGYKGSRL